MTKCTLTRPLGDLWLMLDADSPSGTVAAQKNVVVGHAGWPLAYIERAYIGLEVAILCMYWSRACCTLRPIRGVVQRPA